MSLSYEDRRKTILNELSRHEKVEVQTLADELGVSSETIRRDLDRLEKEGKLRKVYGGAVKNRLDTWELPFFQRTEINPKEKEAIGKAAASLVKQGETVLIDNGTTTIEVVRFLQDRSDVTIVTHSVPTMVRAMEIFKGRVIFIGGEVNALQSATGPLAELMLKQIKVHKAFISVGGISPYESCITEYDLNEANISRLMIERADEAIVLADHSKFSRETFARIAPLQDISMVITDEKCPEEWVQLIKEKGVQVLIADGGE